MNIEHVGFIVLSYCNYFPRNRNSFSPIQVLKERVLVQGGCAAPVRAAQCGPFVLDNPKVENLILLTSRLLK